MPEDADRTRQYSHRFTCNNDHQFTVVTNYDDGLPKPFITCPLAGCDAEAKHEETTDLPDAKAVN